MVHSGPDSTDLQPRSVQRWCDESALLSATILLLCDAIILRSASATQAIGDHHIIARIAAIPPLRLGPVLTAAARCTAGIGSITLLLRLPRSAHCTRVHCLSAPILSAALFPFPFPLLGHGDVCDHHRAFCVGCPARHLPRARAAVAAPRRPQCVARPPLQPRLGGGLPPVPEPPRVERARHRAAAAAVRGPGDAVPSVRR